MKIKASISQKGIEKVGFLFDRNPRTILHELLQNARRAKATLVELQIEEEPCGATKVSISDNGTGIKNPESLLRLWESDWDENITSLEMPAGMGIFSLCHLQGGVTIESGDWKVHLDKDVFEGRKEAETQSNTARSGTKLSFRFPAPESRLNNTLWIAAKTCRYYPIPVKINGQPAEQFDVLQNAKYIDTLEGGRIGILEGQGYHKLELNFHGLDLDIPMAEILPGHRAIVDITSNKLLDLVLPARNAIIENQKWEDLQKEIRKSIYRYAAIKEGGHRLPYKNYKEAIEWGIQIPEAKNHLTEARPQDLHTSWAWGFSDHNNRTPVKPDAVLCHLSSEELAALHLCDTEAPLLFEANTNMEGYSWYPKRAATRATQIITKGKKTYRFNPEEGDHAQWAKILTGKKPEKIELELEIENQDGSKETSRMPTGIAFSNHDFNYDALRECWVESQNPKTPVCANALKSLFFMPPEDGDADLALEEFLEDASDEILRRRQGDDAKCIAQLNRAIVDLPFAAPLRQLKAKSILIKINKDGYPEIQEIQRAGKRKKAALES